MVRDGRARGLLAGLSEREIAHCLTRLAQSRSFGNFHRGQIREAISSTGICELSLDGAPREVCSSRAVVLKGGIATLAGGGDTDLMPGDVGSSPAPAHAARPFPNFAFIHQQDQNRHSCFSSSSESGRRAPGDPPVLTPVEEHASEAKRWLFEHSSNFDNTD